MTESEEAAVNQGGLLEGGDLNEQRNWAMRLAQESIPGRGDRKFHHSPPCLPRCFPLCPVHSTLSPQCTTLKFSGTPYGQ